MLRNRFLLRLVSVMAIGLAALGAPGLSLAASPVSLPPAGMGSVVLLNQDTGPNEMLTVNFAGTTYTVAPQAGTASNLVQFNIAPGTYNYTASVAGIGNVNGTLTVPAGKVFSLAFVDNTADLANGDQNADDQPVVVQTVTADNDEENAEKDEEGHESAKTEESEESASNEKGERSADGDETAAPKATSTPGSRIEVTPTPTVVKTPEAGKNAVTPTPTAKPESTPKTDNNKVATPVPGDKSTGGSNSGSGTFNGCPNPNPELNQTLCSPAGTDKKNKSDVVTIGFAPGERVTAATPAAGGHDKDGDDDNGDDENSEQTTTNVVVPANDNDELLVTVTDITAQAQ